MAGGRRQKAGGRRQWLGHADARRAFPKAKEFTMLNRAPADWLCHADARQVFDLPTATPLDFRVSDPSHTSKGLSGKSETYRASEWQSHFPERAILAAMLRGKSLSLPEGPYFI